MSPPLFPRRPRRIDYPDAMPCLKCDAAAGRHCSNLACSWYDCAEKDCHTRTYILGEPTVKDGKRYWQCLSKHLWW